MTLSAVVAVCRDGQHRFSKSPVEAITLLAGLGVEGDAHLGVTVQHRSRVARDPSAPNLRQVHLIAGELLDELRAAGFDVGPGTLGENITTRHVDLLGLPTGARLKVGPTAVIEVTGLRNPCVQLDRYQRGLTAAVLDRTPEGELIRRAGVMGIVVTDGDVQADDLIGVALPQPPYRKLEPV